MDDIIVYDSVLHSNMKPQEKSMVRAWFEKATGKMTRNTGITRNHVISAGRAFRQTLETNAASFGLGVLHAEIGLDLDLGIIKVPMDFAGGSFLTGLSIWFGDTEVAPDLLNLGTAATNAYSFRKGYDWIAARKKLKGVEPAGKFGESKIHGESDNSDPIKQVAKKF